MSEDHRIRSVAVAGGGIVGLSAALAFARALPWARVELVDLGADPAALADRLPGTLPQIRDFHRLLGIEEPELVRQAETTHRIATRFESWSADGAPWLHGLGYHGIQIGPSPFHHQWARARREAQALPFHAYAPVAALALANKFVHPPEDQGSLLSSFDYALRLDPAAYRRLLGQHALRARVSTRRGSLAGVERRGDGGVGALLLADGGRIEADLFLDCAGPGAPLLSAVDESFEDWGEFLPCDRLLLGESHARLPTPVDEAAATPTGWRWAAPLPSRTVEGAAFASALSDEDEVRESLAPGDAFGSAETIRLRPGRRPRPWTRNVIAFGDAAVAVDAMENANLHLAQSAIGRALSLLPGRDCHPLVLEEYNRRTGYETERVLDFIALHYLASRRRDGPFWEAMPARARPQGLRHTLEQFEGRGRFPTCEEESFRKESWIAVMLGMGIEPRRIDPTAYRVDLAESLDAMERIVRANAALPAQLPSYPDYLVRLIAG